MKATLAPSPARFVEVLTRNGFDVRPWAGADLIAALTGQTVKRDTRLIFLGTLNALIEIRPDALIVIGLTNSRPGNGQFPGFIRRLERSAHTLNVPLSVVQFWNLRLREWFKRRGYALGESEEHGLYAERARPR